MNNFPEINASRTSFDAIIGSSGSVVIDPNIQITSGSGDQAIDGFYCYINNPQEDDDFVAFDSETDSLSLDESAISEVVGEDNVSDIDVDYNNATGVLKCVIADGVEHGTYGVSVWESLARKVKFNTTSEESQKKQVNMILGNKLALKTKDDKIVSIEVQDIADEHTDVDSILEEVEGKTYYGIQGQLATVRNQEVNDFIKDKIRNPDGTSFTLVLIGAKTSADSTPSHKKFEWIGGEDAGQVFYDNGVVEGKYSNFNDNEPNHTSTDTQYLNYTDNGKWNDSTVPNWQYLKKYLLMFEADASDLKFSIDFTINIVSATDAATNLVEDVYTLEESVEGNAADIESNADLIESLRQRIVDLEAKLDIHADLDTTEIVNNDLILKLNNGDEKNLGNVKGEQGNKGDKGDKGDDFNGDSRLTAIEDDYVKDSNYTREDIEDKFTNDAQSVAFGKNALGGTGYKSKNAAFGENAGKNVTSGDFNVLKGYNAGKDLASGDKNILVGTGAGGAIETGDGNVVVGSNTTAKSSDIKGGVTVGNGSNVDDNAVVFGTGNTFESGKRLVVLGAYAVTDAGNIDESLKIGLAGELLIDGKFKVKNDAGEVTQTPEFRINGKTRINGQFEVDSKVTLERDLEVKRDFILYSPDGTRYEVRVNNEGQLIASEIV